MSKYDKYVGASFNNLVCLAYVSGTSKPSLAIYLWQCKCGNTRTAMYNNVAQGSTKYCQPCGSKESAKNQKLAALSTTRHGESKQPLHRAWTNLRVRCTKLQDYIDKGIVCCENWNSYEQFKLDMGDTYFVGAHLDRINTNGNYCKENCQWLSPRNHSLKTVKDKNRAKYNQRAI